MSTPADNSLTGRHGNFLQISDKDGAHRGKQIVSNPGGPYPHRGRTPDSYASRSPVSAAEGPNTAAYLPSLAIWGSIGTYRAGKLTNLRGGQEWKGKTGRPWLFPKSLSTTLAGMRMSR